MIYISNFSKSSSDERAISIAVRPPSWFTGPSFTKLHPPWEIVRAHKYEGMTDEEYTRRYRAEVLSKLDPHEVARELDDRVLLCWCRSNKFCHRHIVADWLREHGYEVQEIESRAGTS